MVIPEQKQKFIASLAPYAQEVQKKYGVPASIVIAQAALESGFNTNAKTLFGIKADSSWQGAKIDLATHEQIGQKMVGITDAFRSYGGNLAQSVQDYGKFLATNRRYAGVLAADGAHEAAEELQRAGYATDKRYAEKLKSIINQYNLVRFDDSEYRGYTEAGRFETTQHRLREQREAHPEVWGDFLKSFFQLAIGIFSGFAGLVFGGEEQKAEASPLPTPSHQASINTPPRRA